MDRIKARTQLKGFINEITQEVLKLAYAPGDPIEHYRNGALGFRQELLSKLNFKDSLSQTQKEGKQNMNYSYKVTKRERLTPKPLLNPKVLDLLVGTVFRRENHIGIWVKLAGMGFMLIQGDVNYHTSLLGVIKARNEDRAKEVLGTISEFIYD